MNRVERLTGLLLTLQQGQASAQALADRFEVSRRTILRDLDALSELGVPVVGVPGRSGGFRVEEGYWLPPLHLNLDETAAVLFALDHAEDASGDSPLGQAHRSARGKIESALKPDLRSRATAKVESIAIARPHTPADPHTTQVILRAISERQWLQVTYQSAHGESERAIRPLSMSVSSGKWYVRAIDGLRRSLRIFRIDRFVNVRYTVPPSDARALTDRALEPESAYQDSSNPEIYVALTETGVSLALDHPDFHQRLIQGDGKAWLRFRCPADELRFYSHELLRFGTAATVLAPIELRAMLVLETETVLRHHRQTTQDSPLKR